MSGSKTSDSELHFHLTDWPALMSREQAAAYLSIGLDALRLLVADGSLRPVMIPGNARNLKFRRCDLDRFVSNLEEVSSSKAIRERQKLTDAARAARSAKQLITRSE